MEIAPGSALRGTIRSLAWEIRRPPARQAQRVDIGISAARIGVSVRQRWLGELEGVTVGDRIIAATRLDDAVRSRFVLAHELGHILIHRAMLSVPSELEEWAADWFARDLLAPLLLVPSEPDPRRLARRFGLPVRELRAQLSAVRVLGGREPVVGWPCGTCGTRPLIACCP